MSVEDAAAQMVGFAPEEILLGQPTRAAKLKWVIVVDEALPAGRAVNAAVCAAAATAVAVPGLLGPEVEDATGTRHLGLPWAGCSILGADSARLAAVRARAEAAVDILVADMPSIAQSIRVYDEYVEQLARTDGVGYYAVSLIGPRNKVDKIVRKLPLLA